MAQPEITTANGRKRFETLAHLSWISVIVAIATIPIIGAISRIGNSREPSLLATMIVGLIVLIGILSGTFALIGVRRYDRKGILMPALIGLGLWFFLLVITLP